MMSGAHRISTPHGSGAANYSTVGTNAKPASLKEGVLDGLGPTVCVIIATLERQLLLTAASQPWSMELVVASLSWSPYLSICFVPRAQRECRSQLSSQEEILQLSTVDN